MGGVDGRWSGGGETVLDLRMAPEKRQLWVRARRAVGGYGFDVSTGTAPVWPRNEGEYVADPVLVYEWEE